MSCFQNLYRYKLNILTGTASATIPTPIPVKNLLAYNMAVDVPYAVSRKPASNGTVHAMMLPFLPQVSSVHPPMTLPTTPPMCKRDCGHE